MRYRSRIDIIGLVLRSAMRGTTKTKLMYDAYLSYSQLREYLSFVEQRELVTLENKIYRLTPRGFQFLNLCEELDELLRTSSNEAAFNADQDLKEYPTPQLN